MIRFKSLRFRNAVTFDNVGPIPLEGQGRVFLSGENKDTGGSNGAGKSTIFEVLQHILFSTTSKGFSRGKFAGKGYKAQLELEVDGHDYKIQQFRGLTKGERSDGYKIWKDGEDVTPKGTRHMQDCINYIKEIIGITEEEFRGYIYLAQEGAGHVLISGKGAAKRDYLSDLFSLDRYDSVKESVAEELSSIKEEETQLAQKAAIRDELKEQLSQLTFNSADFSEYTKSLKSTKEFISEKIETWGSKLKEENAARSKAEERKQTKRQLDAIFPNWEDLDVSKKLASRQENLRKLTDRIEKLEELGDILEEKETLSENFIDNLEITETEARSALRRTRETLASLSTSISGVKRRIALETRLPDVSSIGNDVPARLREAEKAVNVMGAKLTEAQEAFERLSELTEAECPTCGQSLDQEAIREQREKLSVSISQMKSTVVTAKQERKALSSLVKKLEEHATLSAQIGELPSGDAIEIQSRIEELNSEISRLERLAEQAKENARISKRLGELAESEAGYASLDVNQLEECIKQREKLERSIEKLKTIRKLKEQFSTMPSIDLLPENEYDRIKELSDFYTDARSEFAVILADAKTQKKQSETLENRLNEMESVLAAWEPTQKRKTLFEAMKAAYGPKGLKVAQLKKICNAVCRTLPKYTATMFQEPRVEFFVDNDTDSTEIEFYIRRFTKEGTEEYPVGKLSGGEKKRLAVALIFALAELVSPRKRCNLIVLDEVGDGLDQAGEYAFASQLLPQLRQNTVIVTSHRPGIEAAQFDAHWTVTKQDNKSHLSL